MNTADLRAIYQDSFKGLFQNCYDKDGNLLANEWPEILPASIMLDRLITQNKVFEVYYAPLANENNELCGDLLNVFIDKNIEYYNNN